MFKSAGAEFDLVAEDTFAERLISKFCCTIGELFKSGEQIRFIYKYYIIKIAHVEQTNRFN